MNSTPNNFIPNMCPRDRMATITTKARMPPIIVPIF